MKKTVFFIIAFATIFSLNSCKKNKYTLKIDKKVYTPGETIKVQFTADPNWADNAWIGIIPSNVTHGKEAENDKYDIQYKYIRKKAKGSLEFTAPTSPGEYDLRMNDTDNGDVGLEISYVSFKVQ